MNLHYIAEIITALGALIAAYTSYRNKGKLQEIHVLVNSRLDSALKQIKELRLERSQLEDHIIKTGSLEDVPSAPGGQVQDQSTTDYETVKGTVGPP